MCTLSMVMDSKLYDWERRYWHTTPVPIYVPPVITPQTPPFPTALEIEEFRRLLERARQYDKEHGQENCELEEKRQKLRDMAKALGVGDIAFV